MGEAGCSEEIYISYNSGVCILQGFPLFSTLRACRNHLARGIHTLYYICLAQDFNLIFFSFLQFKPTAMIYHQFQICRIKNGRLKIKILQMIWK